MEFTEAKQLAALLIFLHLIVGRQSTAEFVEKPAEKWIAVGEVATFRCQHLRADSVGWRINGTSFIPQSLEGVRTDQTSYESGVVYTLQIYGYASYNRSTIQCEAFFIDSSQRSQLTAAVFLIIQGQLNSVTNIVRAPPETITWNPPFTINLSNADPDIVYCVEVHSITCQREDFYFSEVDCGVTKPFYVNYGLLQGWSYSISITPRSNIEGAQNGSTETKIENFVLLSEPVLLDINRSNVSMRLNYQNTTGAVMPLRFSLLLTSIDGVNNESMIVPALIMDSTNPLFVILTVTLPLSRLWNCRVLPYKCTTAVISSTTQLSTHGLQNVSAFSALSGTVNVAGNFINDPAATGAFIIIHSIIGTQTYYHYAKKDPTNKLNAVLSDISGGNYNVSLFVIEEDREIVERAAILPLLISVAVNNQSRTRGTSDEYLKDNITRVLGGIKVECRFLGNNPTTTCVVVIHKQFDQLGPSGLINIRSCVLNRSGDYASKFIEGVDLDTDIVVVTTFPRISSEGDGYVIEDLVAGIVLAVVIVGVTAIIITVIVIMIKYQRANKRKKEQLLVMTLNVSYASIPPSGKQFDEARQSGAAGPVPSFVDDTRYVDMEKIHNQKETKNDTTKADQHCDKQQSSEDLANDKSQQPKTREGPSAEKVLSSDDGPSCDTLAAAREKPTPPPPFQPKGGHQNIESENQLPSLPFEHGDSTSVSSVQEDVQSVESEEPQELFPSAASEQQSQDFSVKPDSVENECGESASQVFAGPKGMMFSIASPNQLIRAVIGTIQTNIDDVNIDVANKPVTESHGNCDESPNSEIERTEPTEAISAELSEQVVTEGEASSGYPRELPRYRTQRSTNSKGEIEEKLIASPSDSIQAEEVLSIASGNSEPQCMLATFYSPPPSNDHDAIIK